MAFDRDPEAGPLPLAVEGLRLAAGGRTILDGLTFRLEPGRRTVMLGPNGAGKSVTLRILKGLIRPDDGTLRWTGPVGPGALGLVAQRPVLLRRSAEANLAHALGVAGVPRRARAARVAALLALARLEDRADAPARALSGGEQQRLALVRALAPGPRLLLLDEPTASLDPEATAAVEALIGRAEADGVGVLVVTHDLGQARRLADDVVFLHHGRAVEAGPAARFFARPASAEARAYLAGRLLI